MRFLQSVNSPAPAAAETQGFAAGWTAFLTESGLDILLRTSVGESKGRLSSLDAQGNLVGSMFEPSELADGSDAESIALVVVPVSEDELQLTCGSRTWTLKRPAGKAHYFAFLNQWPAKAAPAKSLKDMLARLKAGGKS